MRVSASDQLEEVIAKLNALDPETKAKETAVILARTKKYKWVCNPGPQAAAYFCEADQLLYGGEAGGGKTDLLIGLALQEHKRSLLLRRLNKEVDYLADRAKEILGHSDGYNSQKNYWRMADSRFIQFGGCQHPGDERGYKGQPKDFIGIDEASDFLESMVDFVIGWLRSRDPKQHCRLVLATNPPTTAEGEWIVRWFAPWVDKSHDLYPWPEGELLWFVREGDAFRWLHSPDPIEINGRTVKPLSRTFIRSGLRDNPDYARGTYGDRLAQLPEPLRRRYQLGDFDLTGDDNEWQVIPSQWILEAVARWKEAPPARVPMVAMGLDVAQGGADQTVLAWRHDGWYAPLIVVPGRDTPNPSDAAALIARYRRGTCDVVIDVGGGYGGGPAEILRDGGVSVISFNGATASVGRTKDNALAFANKRAEAWWRFREALDPDQYGGSSICLPDDPRLRADLASARWRSTSRGILIEDKLEIKKRLGRSPDRADAVVMAWHDGLTGAIIERVRSGQRTNRNVGEYDPFASLWKRSEALVHGDRNTDDPYAHLRYKDRNPNRGDYEPGSGT